MIPIDEFVERLCLVGASKGPRRFPRKRLDREVDELDLRSTVVAFLDYQDRRTLEEAQRARLAREGGPGAWPVAGGRESGCEWLDVLDRMWWAMGSGVR